MADDTIAEIGINVDVTGAEEAAAQLDKLGKTGKKTESGLKGVAKGANKTNGPFRAMRGSMQQVSWQLQDVAVQAQMGTDKLVILGQQGPQLLSVFGPGGAVVGALVAFGAMLGGTLYNSIFNVSGALKELEKSSGSLFERFSELNEAMKSIAREQAAEAIAELEKAIENAGKKIKEANEGFRQYMHTSQAHTDIEERLTETINHQAEIIELARENIGKITKDIDDYSDGTEKLIKNLDEQLITLGMTNVELTAYKASLEGATTAQIKQAISIQKAIDTKQKDIDATKEQIKAQIKADADLVKANAKRDADALKQSDKAQKLMQDIKQANMTELEQLEAHLITKGGKLLQFLEQDHITLDQYLAMDAELQKTYDLAEIKANDEKNKKILEDDKALADAKIKIQQEVLAGVSGVIGQLADAA